METMSITATVCKLLVFAVTDCYSTLQSKFSNSALAEKQPMSLFFWQLTLFNTYQFEHKTMAKQNEEANCLDGQSRIPKLIQATFQSGASWHISYLDRAQRVSDGNSYDHIPVVINVNCWNWSLENGSTKRYLM